MGIIEELVEIWPNEVCDKLSLCSEFDKKNLMEFSLISLLLIHFTTVAMCLLSHGPHVTLVMWHTVTVTHCDCDHPSHHCDKVTWYFPTLHLVVVSPIRKEKKRKRNINNDLAVLPSHDMSLILRSPVKIIVPSRLMIFCCRYCRAVWLLSE